MADTREPVVAASLADDSLAGVELIREAASGGMGQVFEGRELGSGRRVAVKLVSDKRPDLARFAAEAEILERLESEYVVGYVAHGVTRSGQPYLVMEWLEGETLAHRVAKGGLPIEAVVTVARRIANALAAAHERNVVHRDVKPSNILLVDRDPARAKLIDFGIARQLDHEQRLTTTGQLIGTPGYMAPEQALGRTTVDGRADLFGLGCVLYEMLYGKPPFAGAEVVEVLARVLMHDPEPITVANAPPVRLASLVRALLAKDPAARLADAHEVGAELDEIARALAAGDRSALRRQPFRTRPTPARRRTIAIASVSAIVLTAGGVAVIAMKGSPDTAPTNVCSGGSVAFTTAWSDARHPLVTAHLTAIGASSAIAGALTTLDGYRERWIAAHRDACAATRIRGEQTEAILDLRMICLERRRQATAAVVELLTATAASHTPIAPALAGLPEIADCEQIALLKQLEPLPTDLVARQRLDGLAKRLADARVQYQIGNFADALVATRMVVSNARSIAYRPFLAEALLLEGQLEHRTGATTAAIPSLEAAVDAAEAGRHDEIAARGWTQLVFVVGYELGETARGDEFARRARAAITRLGGNADIEASLEQALGAIAATRGKLDEAIDHFDKAIPLLEKVFGAEHPNVAGARANLGAALLDKGDTKRAVAVMEQVLAMYERSLPAGHALIGRAMQALGGARIALGDNERGARELLRALAIGESALGPDHPELTEVLANLARASFALDHVADMRAYQRRAITIAEGTYGLDHVEVASLLLLFGDQLISKDDAASGEQMVMRAEVIFAKRGGEGQSGLARCWLARAALALHRNHIAAAVALFERALPVLDHGEGLIEDRARARLGLANAELRRGHPAVAIGHLERAARDGEQLTAASRGAIEFALARALWDGGGDRSRARSLADSAAGLVNGRARDEVAEWRTAHR